MISKVFLYPATIKEIYLDTFGHMNNAMYLTLFEEARWQLITDNGYGLKKITETRIGPTVLEAKLTFMKELLVRDDIIIETQLTSYEGKIGKLVQKMKRDTDICCVAEFVFGLFDLKQRKLILPTQDWLRAVGL